MAVKAKKINELPDGTPDKDSWVPFSDKNGKVFRMPAFLGGGQDFTWEDSAYIGRPNQTTATVNLIGDMTGIGKDLPVKMVMVYKDENGTTFTKNIEIEWQGGSSVGYPKKNYNIDLFNDKEGDDSFQIKFGDWPRLDSYTLKANWTDQTACRNVVVAQLANDIYCTRPLASRYPWSKPFDVDSPTADADVTPNRLTGATGVIDGFPIELKINGESQGLYTWNLPKNKDIFQLAKNEPLQIHLMNGAPASFQIASPPYNPAYWEIKYPKSVTTDTTAAITRMLTFAKTATSDDFLAHAAEYFDMKFLIDYFLMCYCFGLFDQVMKNTAFVTYDGSLWSLIPYDNDISFGCWYEWIEYKDPTFRIELDDTGWYQNPIFQNLLICFLPDIKARYTELRDGPLDPNHVEKRLTDFANRIPVKLYQKDAELWSVAKYPSPGGFHPNRIFNESVSRQADWFRERIELTDQRLYAPTQTALLL